MTDVRRLPGALPGFAPGSRVRWILAGLVCVSLAAGWWLRGGTESKLLRNLHYFDAAPPSPESAMPPQGPWVLEAGAPVELQLDLESTAHVVVVRVDAEGRPEWLRPISTDQLAALPAGEGVLPEATAPYRWSRAEGAETYFVAVSAERPDFLALRGEIEALPLRGDRERRLRSVRRRLERTMDGVGRVDFHSPF